MIVAQARAAWTMPRSATPRSPAPTLGAWTRSWACRLEGQAGGFAWTPIFFGLELPLLAGVEILLLWASCAWLVSVAWSVRRQLGLLLVPYLAWVSFATVLNWSIVVLNV